MVRNTQATRRRVLDAAYLLFYQHGFARVGVDKVADKAGVTKRTLYDHFRSKDDLLAAVLAHHHELALERVRQWGEKLSGKPGDIIDALFADLAIWASKPRWSGSGFTRIVMELADLPGHPARVIARRHKRILESWLAGELTKGKVQNPEFAAQLVMLLIEGAMSLMLVHGDRRYANAAAKTAREIVCGGGPKRRQCARRRTRIVIADA
jgi:AcrR family transcriptional regulator